MSYDRELRFLQDAMQKCRLRNFCVKTDGSPEQEEDLALQRQLGITEEKLQSIHEFLCSAQERTIYKISDRFCCNYLMLRLPEKEQYPILFVGPYLTMELSREQMLEIAERLQISPQQFRLLENFYAGIPVLLENNPLFAMLDALCERIWHGGEITILDVNWELNNLFQPFLVGEGGQKLEDSAWNMRLMEQRYAYENELMQAVSQGSTHKAEMLFSAFSSMSFEQRVTDPVRNLKNYGIIMNTLLRKAAENGGVHPVYLDSVSANFAKKIESVVTGQSMQDLMLEMFRSYCRLVKKNSIKQYSPQVQRAVVQIDSNLSGDLSLKRLAELQNINASYLSTLFKRETGQTVTEYVNQRRVQMAQQLLSTTQLQIQTIAQHCGIPDVNYFSKIFKKYTGKTPKQFRTEKPLYVKEAH